VPGLVDDDVDDLEVSANAYRAIARPYELARACELRGDSHGRRGSKGDAVARLRESIEIYD
jgi:hypothetical protein